MAFNYAFQQIVNLKGSQKTQAEWHLVESLSKLRAEEHSLSDLMKLKTELGDMITNASFETVTISHILLLQEYSEYLDMQIANKQQDVHVAQRIVIQKQEVLTEKMVDEKVWTKAKDKAYQEFVSISLKNEQNVLDEMATNRFKRAL